MLNTELKTLHQGMPAVPTEWPRGVLPFSYVETTKPIESARYSKVSSRRIDLSEPETVEYGKMLPAKPQIQLHPQFPGIPRLVSGSEDRIDPAVTLPGLHTPLKFAYGGVLHPSQNWSLHRYSRDRLTNKELA